jgi:hypothetical protein
MDASSLSISQEIELSLAPVFLLTAIAGLLSFISGRLSRVTDHLREATGTAGDDPDIGRHLSRRIRASRIAIVANLLAAALVCCVIVLIYLSDYLDADTSLLIAALFIGAVFLLLASFVCILVDIQTAARQSDAALD